MKKAHLKIVLVTIFAALLSGCTWLNTETEGGISRGKLIVGMMAVGAGIAGIVHSDSDSGDTILPTRPLPVVGIATSSDSVMEGNAVVLTITSSLPARAGGLVVFIDIGEADPAEFTSTDCDGLVCRVIIAPTRMTALLTITPLPGDDAENVERWTATIVAADTVYTLDRTATTDTFDIADDTFSLAVNGRTLAELNSLITPAVSANPIRNLLSEDIGGVTITASRYDNPSTRLPQVYVQRLEFAALGVWVSGQVPTIITLPTATASDFDHDFRYAFLGDNVLTSRPASGMATYDIEGDATYKGVNFFPDGNLVMNFVTDRFTGSIGVDGATALNHFGSATARVRDSANIADDGRLIEDDDDLSIDLGGTGLGGTITADGFSSTPTISTATGFFADLASGVTGTMEGRFYNADAAGYDPMAGDPSEIAGAGMFADSDGTGDLHFGFLGRCSTDCERE